MLAILLATLVSCGDLCHAEAVAHYADLLAAGGYGRLPVEQAGFLIRERDGTLTFAPWQRGEFQRARFDGSIPRGTIAVVHTHPRRLPRPSRGDLDQARRLGIPLLVVTPDAVIAARPDGGVDALFGAGWASDSALRP